MKMQGSLINRIMESNEPHIPEVGEYVTECMWSDRHAYRVIAVDEDQKGCTIQQCAPKCLDYYSQNYEYEDKDGNPYMSDYKQHIRYKYRKWKTDGGHTMDLCWNCRDEYRDPSF